MDGHRPTGWPLDAGPAAARAGAARREAGIRQVVSREPAQSAGLRAGRVSTRGRDRDAIHRLSDEPLGRCRGLALAARRELAPRRARLELRAVLEARDPRHAAAVRSSTTARGRSTAIPFDHLRNKSGRVWHCRLPPRPDPAGRATTRTAWAALATRRPASASTPRRSCSTRTRARCSSPRPSTARRRRAAARNAGRAPLGVLEREPARQRLGARSAGRATRGTRSIYEMHVRGFTRRDNSGVAAGPPRHLCRRRRQDPVPVGPGRHGGRAAARVPARPPGGQLLGLHAAELLRAPRQYAGGRHARGRDRRDARDGPGAARRRASRSSSTWSTTTPSRATRSGPTYSFRGIDNSTYYLLRRGPRPLPERLGHRQRPAHREHRRPQDGRGQHAVLGRGEMHVDGFRFDLASIFTRRTDGSIDLDDPADHLRDRRGSRLRAACG